MSVEPGKFDAARAVAALKDTPYSVKSAKAIETATAEAPATGSEAQAEDTEADTAEADATATESPTEEPAADNTETEADTEKS